MGDITKLIARVEALTGPDREVDHAIHEATNPPLRAGYRFGSVPKYTASLDAAVALTERALPGQEWSTGVKDGQAWGKVRVNHLHSIADEGPTPAIALILATLKALGAKEVEGD